jgi:ribonucleotide reductase alpha subunit|uniref:ribonucleoside-diphosphate reductase n=1 Tax=viral metagenome TaxID=1070528 RepID=A0A6C0BPU7_9ZZZZ
MFVKKRDGSVEKVSFDKVLRRVENLSNDLNINTTEIAQKVCSRIYDGVGTSELDELTAQLCSSLLAEHVDYGLLSSRITVSNHHKNTSPSFSEVIDNLYKQSSPLISADVYNVVCAHKEKFNTYIDYTRDYAFDFFGFKTLEKAYLMRIDGHVVERPQHLFMRVSIGIHGGDLREVLETYDAFSKKKFIHATPTLFNFGTPRPQGSSCFLMEIEDDSISGIYNTLKDSALISKYAGGIGIHIHNIRGKNSYIRGTNGNSDGIIPMLRVFNSTARYVNQSGRRNGSIAIYLEPWHCDVEGFLDMRKNHGNEEERARDLFYALWIPDLFMERVKNNDIWSLMCPDKCKGLSDVYGDEFNELYRKYEQEGMYIKQITAQSLWRRIIDSQIETGTPYMLYKDSVNKKTNHQNLGVIKSSNLCTEIMEYTSPEESAVCNLASMCLPTYVTDRKFDFKHLHDNVKIVTKNLNKIIDKNFYPIEKTSLSNMRHRPIGIGVQGLADTFILMRYPFESDDAKKLNKQIFETIYHASLEASNEIAKKRSEMIETMCALDVNTEEYKAIESYLKITDDEKSKLKKYKGAYSSYEGSPISKGIYQYDMWDVKINNDLWDWAVLHKSIDKWGIRNSLLLAPMPTASTSQIMGFNECFEPFTSNLYKRKTLAGEFIVINKYLLKDLIECKIWNKDLKDKLIMNEGSVQNVNEISKEIKEIYKTAWEIKQKTIIDMAVDRGAYICQSQSMNLFTDDPNHHRLTTMHFYAWQKGLKTGMYYLRTKPKASTQQFTIDPLKSKSNLITQNNETECLTCSA